MKSLKFNLKKINTLVALLLILCFGCNPDATQTKPTTQNTTQDLFKGFQNPPAEARPFVRWWWNGNKIKKDELDRQLESLKNVGFGGVEINPIAMPVAPPTETESLVWMSDEWIDMVVHACKKTKDLGMIADMIAGTGWPFGGEFLTQDETCQRMVSDKIPYKGGANLSINEDELIARYKTKYKNNRIEKHNSERTSFSLASISLVPQNCNAVEDIIDIKEVLDDLGNIEFTIPSNGDYYLSYQLLQQDFRDVTLGAPGGAGSVMDHYKKEMTLAYLNRMKKISERSGMPLRDLIRALFCDSIEVSGANWSDGFSELFFKTYGYKLNPWMPFVFYQGHQEYSKNDYSDSFTSEFKNQLKRVRYDYNKLLVDVFLKNFTQTYKTFCEDNGILCRYQAYGTPFLMGMLEGYMIPDIPESNNWLYVGEMKDETLKWSQHRGDKIWNLYASAGAHLTGKKITSCEAMTNTAGVFKTTLEEIKQHDDMNFITGINHSVLHGYNYSPMEVPFPGWIRYGAYFSEQNTWWKHLSSWVDYNARLSYVFQNSQAQKSIAIIGPTADLWGDEGLSRTPFHLEPAYLYRMWEPISRLGYSCEYINQRVLEDSKIENGTITYGNMNYKLLVLANLKSITPRTAEAVKTFVSEGGKVVVIDTLPTQSLSFKDYKIHDETVKRIMLELQQVYPKAFIKLDKPLSMDDLSNWVNSFLKISELEPDVVISNPSSSVYQIHKHTEDKEIYFFTNVHRSKAFSSKVKFKDSKKYPYLWNPETGKRTPLYYENQPNEFIIHLEPLQSLLLVFEDAQPEQKPTKVNLEIKDFKALDVIWNITGKRVDGEIFTWQMEKLIDFSTSSNTDQNTFGGEIVYETIINGIDDFTHLDLGNVNEGITVLYINGQKVGKSWYGRAVYPIKEFLKSGENKIKIVYTTVLANYCKSLDNPMANRWTRIYKNKVATGLEGPVKLVTF